MRRGEFARAWQVGDAVLQARSGARFAHLPRHEQGIWSGQALDGRRVLVRCYHGLGDMIRFARYLPLVRARGARDPVGAALPDSAAAHIRWPHTSPVRLQCRCGRCCTPRATGGG